MIEFGFSQYPLARSIHFINPFILELLFEEHKLFIRVNSLNIQFFMTKFSKLLLIKENESKRYT